MRVQTTKDVLEEKDIVDILLNHEQRFLPRVQKLKRYYAGEHDILKKEQRADSAPNNMIVANYCEYIANMSTGFFMGQPVAYSSISGDADAVRALQDVFRYNDEAECNLRLAGEAGITGAAYEVLYLDADAAIRFCPLPSEQMILVTDATLEENLIAAIRCRRLYELDGVSYHDYVEVYDAQCVTGYDYSGGKLMRRMEAVPHYFDGVPVIEYPNNEARRGDFEGVITLVDAYNKAQSLTLDDMEDFTDAYLILKGMGGTTAEDVAELRRNKVIPIDAEGGAEWLIKNLNDTYIENIKTRLQNDIHKFSSIPDMSDDAFAGNTSGVAIKYKLIGLEQVRSRKERCFKKSLQRRIELIADMLKTKSKADIDFRDIEITFTANIPANNQEQADIVKALYGLVSQKRLLSLLPFVTDPAEELEELRKEQEAADDYGIGAGAHGEDEGDTDGEVLEKAAGRT